MTGIYGAGRAFNLKYRPNGPLKTFIYDRRMPVFDFGCRGPRGGGYGSFMQENVVIDYGKRGFWGNLADIFTGLAFGASAFTQIFGMFGGGKNSDVVAGPEESNPKSQGANSEKDLNNLKELGKATGYTTVIQNPGGTYTAYNPTTHQNITGDYTTVQEGMMKKPESEVKTPVKEKEVSKPEVKIKEPEVEAPTVEEGAISAEDAAKLKGKEITIQDEARANSEIYGKVDSVGEPDKGKKNFPSTLNIASKKFGIIKATLVKVDPKTNDAIYQAGNEKYRLRNDDEGNIILTQHVGDEGANEKTGNWHKKDEVKE